MTGCRWIAVGMLVCLACLACLAGPAWAAHTEQRHFAILVDGREAGQAQMTIVQQDDGSVYVSASAKVQVQGLVVNYSFTIDAQEWWKAGKLIGLKAVANDNGKKNEVMVGLRDNQLRSRANGAERPCHPDVWPTSYWKLPEARFHNKQVPLLSVDSGADLAGQLQYLGTKQLPVGSQLIACYHFRVTGAGAPVDLWFDQHHRLVRREFVESGHRTIMQMVSKK
ncbi:MAG: DUF6134 family protein [Gemmataceae bacterium]|nr:DUF6134 family protein [Gemmataceae bacterium]